MAGSRARAALASFARARPFTANAQGAHQHDVPVSSVYPWGTGGFYGLTNLGLVVGGGNGSGTLTNRFNAAWNGTHSHSITAGGDVETRPMNIAVNFYIRIG